MKNNTENSACSPVVVEHLGMRDKLTKFIPYDEGVAIRKVLHEYAKKNYMPKHSYAEYFIFMNNHECSFDVCHAQSSNHPWYFGLFTVKSQHVYGDCVEECLDNAIAA